MILLHLFIEFFLVGLLAVGGGLATIPFLTDMAERTGWFTLDQLTNMIAVSESTPGPLGVNMASYVGYETAGIAGAVTATVGLITPCVIIIVIIAACLKKFRDIEAVNHIFYGLRPASTGLIAAAGWSVLCLSILTISHAENSLFQDLSLQCQWPCVCIALAVLLLTHLKPTKKAHPVVWIALSAVAGIIFQI